MGTETEERQRQSLKMKINQMTSMGTEKEESQIRRKTLSRRRGFQWGRPFPRLSPHWEILVFFRDPKNPFFRTQQGHIRTQIR